MRLSPTIVRVPYYVTNVCCGGNHTALTTGNSRLYVCGKNSNGQCATYVCIWCMCIYMCVVLLLTTLNINTTRVHTYMVYNSVARENILRPVRVEAIKKERVLSVICGYSHTACITSRSLKFGAVWCWGVNSEGQCTGMCVCIYVVLSVYTYTYIIHTYTYVHNRYR